MVSFHKRVAAYIEANYDFPKDTEFIIGGMETDLEDWVEEYVEALNGNVSYPYGDGADEADVREIGDEILGMLVTGSPCRAFDSDGHPMIISIPLPED